MLKNWKPGFLHLIVLLTILQLLVTLLTDGFALSFDEAMWQYIGRNWFRNGLVPYNGGVDNKSPVIFAVFGLSDKLFGVNYWFGRVLGTLVQSVGIYYIFKLAKHIAGEQAGILAISFYGLSLLWHGTGGRYVSFTETYDMVFIIIAAFKFVTAQNKKDFFISGLMAGLGLAFRLSAVWGIIAISCALLRRNRMSIPVFFAGIAASIALFLAISFLAGIDIHSIITNGLVDNFGSGSATDRSLIWKMVNFSDKFFYSELILFYPFVLGYFFIKKKIDLFSLWLILEFVGINIVGIYGTLHMRELLPAMSVMSALCVTYLINQFSLPAKPLIIIIWLVFFPKLLEPLLNIQKIFSGDKSQPDTACHEPYDKPDEGSRKKLGWWIRDNTSPQDMVYVAGFGAQVQAYSERISPTIYFNVTQTQLAKDRFYSDMQKNKPAMILVPLFAEYHNFVSQDMRQFVDELVAKEYYLDRCMYNYNVYRIKK
ncbi:glycosyltransferase family 39 protein [Mucilaginibacter sp. BT774]|uniref:ArnT family glycosyltransferase n=1 Tax=Mucilaginibacter sp. BT774 TaxID=3062276 RepID=UPI0026761128|nr:glycosyltransferase family 39 protein [Mucilaginibacter sp. BT774]MDO3624776.1 glycosyltransferase family 39 protein [Mucilaginibacter sp. BT774]